MSASLTHGIHGVTTVARARAGIDANSAPVWRQGASYSAMGLQSRSFLRIAGEADPIVTGNDHEKDAD